MMYTTTCARCGKKFPIPFKPTKDTKEMLCPKCFAKEKFQQENNGIPKLIWKDNTDHC